MKFPFRSRRRVKEYKIMRLSNLSICFKVYQSNIHWNIKTSVKISSCLKHKPKFIYVYRDNCINVIERYFKRQIKISIIIGRDIFCIDDGAWSDVKKIKCHIHKSVFAWNNLHWCDIFNALNKINWFNELDSVIFHRLYDKIFGRGGKEEKIRNVIFFLPDAPLFRNKISPLVSGNLISNYQ